MFGRESKTTHIDILLGRSARVHGDVEFSGGLHVEGLVLGNVQGYGEEPSTLSVGETGCIEGSVSVTDAVLNGTVKGDIRATGRVVLGEKAKVQGNVYYSVIETSLGAEIMGKLVRVAPPEAEAKSAT